MNPAYNYIQLKDFCDLFTKSGRVIGYVKGGFSLSEAP